MPTATAGNEKGHPVNVECPSCSHLFRVPLKTCSAGTALVCPDCGSHILISTLVLRQLLEEIDNDLLTPDDLPIKLRPTRFRPAGNRGSGKDKAPTA